MNTPKMAQVSKDLLSFTYEDLLTLAINWKFVELVKSRDDWKFVVNFYKKCVLGSTTTNSKQKIINRLGTNYRLIFSQGDQV